MPKLLSIEQKYQNLLKTIKMYPDQLKQAWDEVTAMEFPHDFGHVENVAACAMGGSNLGARIVDSLLVNRIRVPVEIFNQYHIPNYSDDKTLIISYSYSGNTEEAVACLNEAISRETKIFVVTAGGKLKIIAESHNLPRYIINPKNNPSGQPRNAIGYAIGAILGLFAKTSIAHISEEEIESSISAMKQVSIDYDTSIDTDKNLANHLQKNLKTMRQYW